ncbi:XcbB/CpsF family capsular polysaccharide biosynthesis protein [Psychrobacter celer]|uniref:XcbB/CpsF family capsular polysaccharide biosynthesis protein n=1 Tax=Psychrobacter celer TaxID=306572 RepID=UPI003FD18332
MNSKLHISFNEHTLFNELNIDYRIDEIYIDKSTIGKSEKERLLHNFLAVARQNKEAKKLIAKLSSNQFYLVKHSNGVSVFKRFSNVEFFKTAFSDHNIKCWNNTFYTLDEPISYTSSTLHRLLVVFSSIADFPFNASLSRRMFFKNYSSIGKYIPRNTYILRIADLGGVLGSFYLNSNADPKFESKVQSIIRKIQMDKGINDNQTVFYGTSKGGTGALYHGLKMGIKTLSVDPIVSDDFYINKHNDLHFVEGAFPIYKDEKFSELMRELTNKKLSFMKIITSPNSEQFEYIRSNIFLKNLSINKYIFTNPSIKTHPDVGKHTLSFSTTMLNNLLYNINIDQSFTTEF